MKGRHPKNGVAMTNAERQAAWRARLRQTEAAAVEVAAILRAALAAPTSEALHDAASAALRVLEQTRQHAVGR